MSTTFAARLAGALKTSDSLVCVGLDPDLARLPREFAGVPEPLLAFNRRIIDATADLAAAFKPQIAFYSALAKEDELAASIRYIRQRAPHALVILDAKRNDIGNTAEAYASEAFDRYGADAVTVNYGINRWWRGYPPAEIYQALQEIGAQKAGEETAGPR